MENCLSFGHKLLLPEYYLFYLFIGQNKEHVGEMSVCVPLSRRSSEADGQGEAPVLHWPRPGSAGTGSLRLAQMLSYVHGFRHSWGNPGRVSPRKVRRQRLPFMCSPGRELERWEKTQPLIMFLVELGDVSGLAAFVNEQDLLSWRNICFRHQCILTEKSEDLKLWLIACFNEIDNKVNHVYGNKSVLRHTLFISEKLVVTTGNKWCYEVLWGLLVLERLILPEGIHGFCSYKPLRTW